MKITALFLLCALTFSTGCINSDLWSTQEEVQAVREARDARMVVSWFGGCWLVNDVRDTAKGPLRIDTLITDMRVSHDYSKIAILGAGNLVTVIDTFGAAQAVLAPSSTVVSMDWTGDDQTLWVLNDSGFVEFIGPPVAVPPFSVGAGEKVVSMSMSVEGHLAYVVHSPVQDRTVHVIGGDVNNPIVRNGPVSPRVQYVSFSGHGTDLAVGFADSSSHLFTRLELFTDLTAAPVHVLTGSYWISPTWRSDLNRLFAILGTNVSSIVLWFRPASIPLQPDGIMSQARFLGSFFPDSRMDRK